MFTNRRVFTVMIEDFEKCRAAKGESCTIFTTEPAGFAIDGKVILFILFFLGLIVTITKVIQIETQRRANEKKRREAEIANLPVIPVSINNKRSVFRGVLSPTIEDKLKTESFGKERSTKEKIDKPKKDKTALTQLNQKMNQLKKNIAESVAEKEAVETKPAKPVAPAPIAALTIKMSALAPVIPAERNNYAIQLKLKQDALYLLSSNLSPTEDFFYGLARDLSFLSKLLSYNLAFHELTTSKENEAELFRVLLVHSSNKVLTEKDLIRNTQEALKTFLHSEVANVLQDHSLTFIKKDECFPELVKAAGRSIGALTFNTLESSPLYQALQAHQVSKDEHIEFRDKRISKQNLHAWINIKIIPLFNILKKRFDITKDEIFLDAIKMVIVIAGDYLSSHQQSQLETMLTNLDYAPSYISFFSELVYIIKGLRNSFAHNIFDHLNPKLSRKMLDKLHRLCENSMIDEDLLKKDVQNLLAPVATNVSVANHNATLFAGTSAQVAPKALDCKIECHDKILDIANP